MWTSSEIITVIGNSVAAFIAALISVPMSIYVADKKALTNRKNILYQHKLDMIAKKRGLIYGPHS